VNLYIMSRGRAGKVTTLASVPPSWYDRTYIVTNQGEELAYKEAYPHIMVVVVPSWITNYSQKFQFILDGLPYGHLGKADDMDKAVILDDDLVFSRKDDKGRLVTIREPEQIAPMFEQIEVLLDKFPLVGVHPRAMGQDAPEPYVTNQRIICVQGLNRRLIGRVKSDQFPILADVVLTLSLLGRGDEVALVTTYFQDHGPCQAPGGCSIYRTPEMQERAIDYLVGRFPAFVKKVTRKPKVAKWMGDERVEYVAQWKRLQKAAPEKVK